MSSEFDPSPRASKRRKTAKYGAQRTILSDDTPPIPETNAAPTSSSSKRRSTRAAPAQVIDEAPLREVGQEDEHGQNPTPSKSARRSQKANGFSQSLENVSINNSAPEPDENQPENLNGKHSQEDTEEVPAESIEQAAPKLRSSGRQKKKPSRFSDGLDHVVPLEPVKDVIPNFESPQKKTASPVVKGILTPSRRQKAQGPRKSVMFDQDDAAIGEQLGFKDIGTPLKPTSKDPVKKRSPRKAAKAATVPLPHNNHVDIEPSGDFDVVDEMIVDESDMNFLTPDFTASKDITSTSLPETNPHLQAIKAGILSRLTSASLPPRVPDHLESQYDQLQGLLRATIASSESNSLLLLGPRGAGKSMLLALALRQLSKEHSSDFHTVHLNGFLQTDDRLALREIWRQLGREMQVDEVETEDVAGSYADTMASLLSLLSHPDELAPDGQDNAEDMETLASNAIQLSGGGQRMSKSIVFILDEFDLFTMHPRQTLLYNLFDIAQSRKAPIAVIGCSTRMDAIECLEKRVKSRFSHRWLLVPGCKTLLEWETCVKEAILFQGHETLALRSKEESTWRDKWNHYIESDFLPLAHIQKLVKSHFYTTKSLPDLFMALYPLIAQLTLPPSSSSSSSTTTSGSTPPPPASSSPPTTTTPDIDPPGPLKLLAHLPTLHLSFLISHSRLETIHHLPSANFNLVHTHYTELVAQARLRQAAAGSISVSGSLRAWTRDTCRAAWEDLGVWGLVVPASGSGARGGDDAFGSAGAGEGGDAEETRMWRCEITLDDLIWAIGEREGGGEAALERWCREI